MSEPKYIRFEKDTKQVAGHAAYWIINKRSGDILGRILWYAPWRNYIAEFSETAAWSAGCLDDVSAFIKGLKP